MDAAAKNLKDHMDAVSKAQKIVGELPKAPQMDPMIALQSRLNEALKKAPDNLRMWLADGSLQDLPEESFRQAPGIRQQPEVAKILQLIQTLQGQRNAIRGYDPKTGMQRDMRSKTEKLADAYQDRLPQGKQ